MTDSVPWIELAEVERAGRRALRDAVIFEGSKWDPQIGDQDTISPSPIALRRSVWNELVGLATALAGELESLERFVLGDRAALAELALPRELERVLPGRPSDRAIRIARFDFHLTDEGWRISEVNADVPGGLHEGVVASIYARHHPGFVAPGDPARAIADAFAARLAPGSNVALVHATAYSDDRQVVELLSRALHTAGLVGVPCAPDHVVFAAAPEVRLGGERIPIDGLYRFFPAEWLPNFGRSLDVAPFVRPPLWSTNPATALVGQSKRLPLVFARSGLDLPAFRALLPQTLAVHRCPPRELDRFVLKPGLGRVGGGIVSIGASRTRDLVRGAIDAVLHPRAYVVQRRFRTVPWPMPGGARTVCIGVFTLDGRVVGAYGRSTPHPFVDHRAIDTPVLIERESGVRA